MATTTTARLLDERTRTRRAGPAVRDALRVAWRKGIQTASAARHRYRRPALVVGSFGCIDAAAWTTFGRGAGLLALGTLGLVFEALGSDE